MSLAESVQRFLTADIRLRAADGGQAASPAGQLAWALFEWARNPYVILITIYIFAPYFSAHVVGDPKQGQSIWGWINGIAGFFIAALAPFLGAIADRGGARKPWLAAFVALMCLCCLALWWAMPGGAGLSIVAIAVLIVIVAVVFEFSAVFHNAMLPAIATERGIAGLSGLGLALGNAAGILLLVFVLVGFALPGAVDWGFVPDAPWFGLDREAHEHERLAGPLIAVWLALFALPLFLLTPDRPVAPYGLKETIVRGLTGVVATLRSLKHYSNVALYLLARAIYNDGKTGILIFGGVYAAGVFGWGPLQMTIYGIVLSIFAVLGGLLGGWLDDRFGSQRAILISIGSTALGLVLSLSMAPDTILFFIPYDTGAPPLHGLPFFRTLPELLYLGVVILIAVFITAAYANSRTMLARIAPPERMTEFFGLYALSGTATAFLAPLSVGLFTSLFDSQQAGMASLLIFLVGGFVLMLWVRQERATAAP